MTSIINPIQNDQLKRLDNSQRAEFLRMKRSHVACSGVIRVLRKKTEPLYQKQKADQAHFDKLEIYFLVFIAVLLLLNWIFTFPIQLQLGAIFLALLILAVFILFTKIHSNHDQMLVETYILEIMRYQAELQMMGLAESYLEEDDLTRDILRSLGFDSGLIGGSLEIRPLEAAQ
jgi:hypothetical protein